MSVTYIDGNGASRRSPADCQYGVSYVTIGDTVYWPLSADDAQRLNSAACGTGEFTGPAGMAPEAEQKPAAWARMKGGIPVDLYFRKKQAELFAGFAGGKLEPLYLHPQPAPDVTELLEALTPQVLDWMRCGLAANGHLQDGDHPALAKLRAAIDACRKQGGEL